MLLPPYDEYLIGYKSRDLVLPSEHSHRAHNNMGTFRPVVAHDGLICGNWAPFQESAHAEFFQDVPVLGLAGEWARYHAFKRLALIAEDDRR